MDYNLILSDRKTVAIIIKVTGEVQIRAPKTVSKRYIQQLFIEKKDWIDQKINQIRKKIPQTSPKQFITGEKFLYLGKIYTLQIVKYRKAPFIQGQTIYLPEIKLSNPKQYIQDQYKKKFRILIQSRVEQYADKMNVSFQVIKLSSAKTRWGSCSAQNNLNFNWRLIMAPIDVIDYVVVHELVHTIHKNHSHQFWQLVCQSMTDYVVKKNWLKDNGYTLVL